MEIKIIAAIIASVTFVYHLVLGIVQRRSANNPTPESVSDVYDTETYLKWKKYSGENRCILQKE